VTSNRSSARPSPRETLVEATAKTLPNDPHRNYPKRPPARGAVFCDSRQASHRVSSLTATSRRLLLRRGISRRNKARTVAQNRSAAAIAKTSCSEVASAVRAAWRTAPITTSLFRPKPAHGRATDGHASTFNLPRLFCRWPVRARLETRWISQAEEQAEGASPRAI